MVIVRLMGGLGNQMLQYAAGRRLAYSRSEVLRLDIGWYDEIPPGDTARKYGLQVFNIVAERALPDELAIARRIRQHKLFHCIMRYLPNFTWSPGWKYVYQNDFQFDARLMKLSGHNIYLDGYWFSEKYFLNITDIIRNEFTIKESPDIMNEQLARTISASPAVSVHVRRGDYVSNLSTSMYHGTCSTSYYTRAIESIANKVPSAHFFIFSDDPQWTKSNIRTEYQTTYVDHNPPERAYEDLRLMRLCKHHIIANSTLSWWGAWLSEYPDNIVIAPQRWFANRQINTEDLLPENWLRM